MLGGEVEGRARVGRGVSFGLGSSILEGCELGFGELVAFAL